MEQISYLSCLTGTDTLSIRKYIQVVKLHISISKYVDIHKLGCLRQGGEPSKVSAHRNIDMTEQYILFSYILELPQL
jgi:hypothetical protein